MLTGFLSVSLSGYSEKSVMLFCCHALTLQYVSFFVPPVLSHPLKASIGVSPLIKLFVQVAHFAVTRSNCECEKTVFSRRLGVGQETAPCHAFKGDLVLILVDQEKSKMAVLLQE